MGKKRWIVASILSSSVVPTLVSAVNGGTDYREATNQITTAFTTAFSWLPEVLRVKAVVFGLLVIFFWVFLYNLLLTGIKKWMVKEGEATKMHKTMAGSLAAIIILSVFFVTEDPMAKAQRIAGSMQMFFAIALSVAVYYISKYSIRSNTDGNKGGFESVLLGLGTLLLLSFLAEGTALSAVRYPVMAFAILFLIIALFMKIASATRGTGTRHGYDPFGDRTDQLPRSPGSFGDSFSRFAGAAFDAGGGLWRWWKNRNLGPKEKRLNEEMDRLEQDFRTQFDSFNKIYEFYREKTGIIVELPELYHKKWKKCNKFLKKKLPSILDSEVNYIKQFIKMIEDSSYTVKKLLKDLLEIMPEQITPAQGTEIARRFDSYKESITEALNGLWASISAQEDILKEIRKKPYETEELVRRLMAEHLSEEGDEYIALTDLHTVLEEFREDAQEILGLTEEATAPEGAEGRDVASEIGAHLDESLSPFPYNYESPSGITAPLSFNTLRDFFKFFKSPGVPRLSKASLFEEYVANRPPEQNAFANWIASELPSCTNLVETLRSIRTYEDFEDFIATISL